MVTEEQWKKRCEELLHKEITQFGKDIYLKADFLYHPKNHYLDIFILMNDIGAILFVKYYLDKDTMEVVTREQVIATAGAADILRPLLE
ncbi:hypothetical protein MKX83_03490 [Cytobacillus sp. FSL M8-0252]|uniref:hypothetical protein n=1 Tax=Cytobacillus sp. FSL M8-0252 TaxID=2921621 RepID=UPI0030F6E644